jgi:SsrA-binding protein
MHKKEILKLNNKITLEGYTLIPLKVYFKDNKAKVLLGLCKGKKDYDKRESMKERDIQRELQRKNKF